ncbi:hypothetical protein Dip518_001414 [Parelusimicrobium proximum]|uniref:hypothetical protein n=1 Tax=Parelusimicrobium proximum TaxID=3228953 RepID=UPI003D1814F7
MENQVLTTETVETQNIGVQSNTHLLDCIKEASIRENQPLRPKNAIGIFSKPDGLIVSEKDFKISMLETLSYAEQNDMKMLEKVITSGDFYSDMTTEYNKIVDYIERQDAPVAILIGAKTAFSMSLGQVQEIIALITSCGTEIHLVGPEIVISNKNIASPAMGEFLEFLFVPTAKELLIEKCKEMNEKGTYESRNIIKGI